MANSRSLLAARREVAKYARRLVRDGLILDYEGNLSLRLPREKRIVITPSQHPKSQLLAEQVLIIDYRGRIVQGSGKPSSEMKMHLAIFKHREDVDSIIHTHSVYASAFAASHQKLPSFLDEQSYFLRGDVLCTDYAPAGSEALAKSATRYLGNRFAVLLANHGVLSCGGNLEEAFRNALLVERAAKIYLLSQLLDRPKKPLKKASLSRGR